MKTLETEVADESKLQQATEHGLTTFSVLFVIDAKLDMLSSPMQGCSKNTFLVK